MGGHSPTPPHFSRATGRSARDLREGVAAVVLGSEWAANQAAQEAAEAAGFPEGWLERLPPVRNLARRRGLPRALIEKLRVDPWKDKGP